MIKYAAIFALLPIATSADTLPPLSCGGEMPEWSLQIIDDTAQFDFQRQSDMTIPQRTMAEGQDWPHALTLISRFDTAIVIIDQRQCGTDPYTAEVLTQRGETPILLTGCCTASQ